MNESSDEGLMDQRFEEEEDDIPIRIRQNSKTTKTRVIY